MRVLLLIFAAVALWPAASAAEPLRSERILDGPWEFCREGEKSKWKPVTVPSSMQSHEGTDWHGIGVYRRSVGKLNIPAGKRLLLHFTAVATFAEVFWNGTKVGEHLGGWTSFRLDVTDLIRDKPADFKHILTIKVDERVGHNTQGFLPIVQPHFGGIWQPVKLITVPDKFIDDLRALPPPDADLPVWSPNSPKLKEVVLINESNDRVHLRTARRTVATRGDQLLLNGRPLQVRGVLNWGYYPPTLEPIPADETWRADLRRLQARGFNLMKCCLWIPPARLLEIADEEGMLIWIEYPTWHPQLTPKHLAELTREFEEFFAHVRNHPCVILHSLTCETGPRADINVIKALTGKCKAMIPGAIVEDDSSWIEWNRVTDFYDDHPYGNNHTWVEILRRLRDYKALGIKPLLLGEAIAADTWTPTAELAKHVGSERPYWLPHHFQANAHWLYRMRERGWNLDQQQLVDDSKRYALLMRKYQIETFRREIPDGGYVVSVIRDFPLAAMGLIDYRGRDKWPSEAWKWHGETMLTIQTESDRRTFASGDNFIAKIRPVGPLSKSAKVVVLWTGDNALTAGETNSGDVRVHLANVTQPARMTVAAMMNGKDGPMASNEWSMWVAPRRNRFPRQ